jgi:hypothetical protein
MIQVKLRAVNNFFDIFHNCLIFSHFCPFSARSCRKIAEKPAGGADFRGRAGKNELLGQAAHILLTHNSSGNSG